MPELRLMARANRDFVVRAVRHLVVDRGVVQFLDVGSGLPTMNNVHQVAEVADPAARVVYVDNDPLVAAHARALLVSMGRGRTGFVAADATDPASVLADPVVAQTLDLRRPVALMLVSVLMYFDDATTRDIVLTLMGALPSGSYLTLSHPTGDFTEAFVVEQAQKTAQVAGLTYRARTRGQIEALFDGLELCEPGVVPMRQWLPGLPGLRAVEPSGIPTNIHYYVGVGRKR